MVVIVVIINCTPFLHSLVTKGKITNSEALCVEMQTARTLLSALSIISDLGAITLRFPDLTKEGTLI